MPEVKFLRVTMPDKSKWDIPAEVIANNRTEYYAKVDGFGPMSGHWEEEFEQSMKPYELKDWAANNMDWKDVVAHAIPVEDDYTVDYQEGWINGHKELIFE